MFFEQKGVFFENLNFSQSVKVANLHAYQIISKLSFCNLKWSLQKIFEFPKVRKFDEFYLSEKILFTSHFVMEFRARSSKRNFGSLSFASFLHSDLKEERVLEESVFLFRASTEWECALSTVQLENFFVLGVAFCHHWTPITFRWNTGAIWFSFSSLIRVYE